MEKKSLARKIIAPGKYIQGPDEIDNIGKYYKEIGQKAYIVISPSNLKMYGERVKESFKKEGIDCELEEFNRECSYKEIDRLVELAKTKGVDGVIGFGGGKPIDTAKVVADRLGQKVIVVPTIASTDAPCSALSVIYTDDGVFLDVVFFKSSPYAVIMDTKAIAKAPARFLVAGMGDALATYFEARMSALTDSTTAAGGKTSRTAQALAELSYDILLECGLQAKLSCEAGVTSKAFEDVVEANTYLSGLGFESGGLAAAHSIHNGLTALPATHSKYHGEKVAFGVITQLVMENAPLEEIHEVVDFCQSVGLPTCFADLDIPNVTEEELWTVAKMAHADANIHNMNFPVTVELVYSAMVVADKLGQ